MQKPDPNGNCFGISCHRFWQNVCTYIYNSGVDGDLKSLQLRVFSISIIARYSTLKYWYLVPYIRNSHRYVPIRLAIDYFWARWVPCTTQTFALQVHHYMICMYKIAIVPECPIRLWFEFWCIHTLTCTLL